MFPGVNRIFDDTPYNYIHGHNVSSNSNIYRHAFIIKSLRKTSNKIVYILFCTVNVLLFIRIFTHRTDMLCTIWKRL